MSESMIERVARALCVQRGEDPDEQVRWLIAGTDYEEGEPYPRWDDYRQQARAAIGAMGDPTDAMWTAGFAETWDGERDANEALAEGYAVMIETALKGE